MWTGLWVVWAGLWVVWAGLWVVWVEMGEVSQGELGEGVGVSGWLEL